MRYKQIKPFLTYDEQIENLIVNKQLIIADKNHALVKLRTLIFQNICSIEQKIRSLISYHFCETYSENQNDYLNPHNYNNTNKNRYAQYLKVLTHFRNICAHNERLFSFKSRYEIPDTALHRKMHIPKNREHFVYGKSDMFAIVIAFRYLLDRRDFLEFKKAFKKSIISFAKKTDEKKTKKLLKAMGVPTNLESITRYKL